MKRSVTPSLSASTPVIDVVIERRVVAGVETVDHVCIDAKRLQRIARVEQGERPSVAIGPSHLAQNVAQAHGVVPQRFALRLVSFHDPDVLIAPAMRRYPRRCPETSSSTVFRDVILGLVPRTHQFILYSDIRLLGRDHNRAASAYPQSTRASGSGAVSRSYFPLLRRIDHSSADNTAVPQADPDRYSRRHPRNDTSPSRSPPQASGR